MIGRRLYLRCEIRDLPGLSGVELCHCSRCRKASGSPVPDPNGDTGWLEVPAGLLDDDPRLRPDRHIFVDVKSPWFKTMGDLPQLDRAALKKLRKAQVQQ